ncbi:MAG: tRNA (adenosine(37)-N6)-threonylcarbamoyltransferase complex ATPase subunit type 1 TsaE [Proteobacteria bacterium]|nr:tRNA (adenosine(37)-N6)-threonylcarbamoyltransferase complex ATPase subunit type 1 TsaE [Pseudomonadota bacterium]
MDSKELLNFFLELKLSTLSGKVIGLVGDLGAGKTYLVKKLIASQFEELETEVNSPTYTICNVYKTKDMEIHHYDLYRIESEDELYDTGVLESIELGTALVFIEWVDMHPDLVEACDFIVNIELISETGRIYSIR